MAHQSPQSKLEIAYNLDVPAMAEYMNIAHVSLNTTPVRLIELASDMAGHSHALVRYAAGWAATEAGLIGKKHAAKNDWTLKHREQAISLGNEIWHGIDETKWAAIGPDTDQRQGDLWALSMRQRIAMAYLPAMQLVARQRAGQPHTLPGVHERFRRVRTGLMSIMQSIIAEPSDVSRRGYAMRGLANELAVGWLLQPELLSPTPSQDVIMEKPDHVVTPASLREDHHQNLANRVDLSVYALSAKGKRTAVQVSTEPKETQSNTFEVATSQYFGTTFRGQDVLGQIYRSETTDHSGNPYLADVSRNLIADMTRFTPGQPSV